MSFWTERRGMKSLGAFIIGGRDAHLTPASAPTHNYRAVPARGAKAANQSGVGGAIERYAQLLEHIDI